MPEYWVIILEEVRGRGERERDECTGREDVRYFLIRIKKVPTMTLPLLKDREIWELKNPIHFVDSQNNYFKIANEHQR